MCRAWYKSGHTHYEHDDAQGALCSIRGWRGIQAHIGRPSMVREAMPWSFQSQMKPPCNDKPSQVKPSQAQPSHVKPSQAASSRVKPRRAAPSQDISQDRATYSGQEKAAYSGVTQATSTFVPGWPLGAKRVLSS